MTGTFGRVEIAVPRARLDSAAGKTTESKSSVLRAYQRRTKPADSVIAGAYLTLLAFGATFTYAPADEPLLAGLSSAEFRSDRSELDRTCS